MKRPIIKILTRCTLHATRFFLIIAAIILCTKSLTIAADPPHSSANSVYCNSCHSVHKASGTSLTNNASNANLCQSCHVSGGLAETKRLADSMLATPGTLGTSHRWDATMPAVDGPNNQYGLIPTANLTSAALKGRLTTYGKVTCSVCHNQHGQADTPWAPNAPAYTGQGTGSGRHFQRISDDLNQMCEDCHYYRKAGTTGTNVKIYDGNKKSHSVVKNLTTDVIDAQFVGAAPLETNNNPQTSAPRYHQDGTEDINPSNNVVLDSLSKTRCLSCHGIHYTDSSSGTIDDESGAATGDGYLLKRSPEETCHACHKTDQNRTGLSPDWADAIKTHNANRFGTCTVSAFSGTSQTECGAAGGTWTSSTKWGANWGLPGGKYGEIVCTTCHTAHDTKNIYLIKEIIKTPDGSFFQGRVATTVALGFRTTATGNSGAPGLMGDDTHAATTSSRICEVCHTYDATQTSGVNKHAYNMSSDGAKPHQGIGGCTTCHSHKGAFTGGGCTGCHGCPPVADTAAPPDGLAWTNPTGSTVAGAHNLHYTTKSYSCTACHYNSSGSGATHGSSGDGLITMGFYMFDGDYQGGNYDGQTGTDGYNVPSPNTATATTVTDPPTGAKKCSNIYCHGSTMAPNGGSDTTPIWDNSATGDCGTCHGATAANPPSRGNHSIHTIAYLDGYNYSCSLCHKDPNSDASLHVNNKSEVVFSSDPKTTGGIYGGTETMLDAYGTCTNIYCHSTVQSSPPGSPVVYDSPTWGSTLVAPHCSNNCHYSGHAVKLATGSHTKHFEYGTEPTCQRCHNYYNKDSCAGCHSPEPTLKPRDKHANGSIDVAFAPIYGGSAGTYSGAPTPGDAYGSCSNTYCHGKYNGSGLNASPTWGGTADCGTCHGASNTSHPTSGSHERHVTATNLLKGVDQATANREYACTLCHKDIVEGSGPSSYTISDKIKHVSGKVDWKFDTADSMVSGTSTYSIASGTAVPSDGTTPRAYGTCSNVYCHSIVQTSTGGALTPNTSDYTTVTWGVSVTCGNCHKQDGSHYVGAVMDSGSHTKHLSYTFTAVSSYMKCELCHSYGVPNISVNDCDSCHSTGEKTKHVNGVVNVDFYTSFVGAGGAYNGTAAPGDGYINCSNTYCHSNGTGGTTQPGDTRPIADNTSANWGGSVNCESCHGVEVVGSSGSPSYANGSVGGPKANSHIKHVARFGCHYCHAGTTSDGTTITSKENHVNKVYNVEAGAGLGWKTQDPIDPPIPVSFTYTYNSTGGTCTDISCHFHTTNATWGGKIPCSICHGGVF